MNLEELIEYEEKTHWVLWKDGSFAINSHKPGDPPQNRETLARFYVACLKRISCPSDQASKFLRVIWRELASTKRLGSLPKVIGEDGFLKMYAFGTPLQVDLAQKILSQISKHPPTLSTSLEPIHIEWNDPDVTFHDANATPPGLLPKLFTYFRLKKDREILKQIVEDFEIISQFEDDYKRKFLTLAMLSHGVAYREIEGLELLIPSFITPKTLIPYTCHQHLVAEGVKTVSLIPKETDSPSIYLCQGTELWPSQPSMLGSILANFAAHGSATEAYAHSWRRIHKHLRALPGSPIVAGHSMGGSLAMQIGLYSHHLVKEVYAYNPPVPNERDYHFYLQISKKQQDKIVVTANLDDFAFWRVGAKVIGNVTIFLTRQRWDYYSVGLRDCILLFPACIKFIRNVWHAFPAHQNITALYPNWVSVKLSQEEIEKENLERIKRFDYLRFFPKLYDPMKLLIRYIRKLYKWPLEDLYLRNEIEILALHERDLIDTRTEQNADEIEQELKELRRQKEVLVQKLFKKRRA